jgi:hypothetical protein
MSKMVIRSLNFYYVVFTNPIIDCFFYPIHVTLTLGLKRDVIPDMPVSRLMLTPLRHSLLPPPPPPPPPH